MVLWLCFRDRVRVLEIQTEIIRDEIYDVGV